MPTSPVSNTSDEGHHYEVSSLSEKFVLDYTGLNFLEVIELPIDIYLSLQRDAFIYNLNKTESGREYLESAWLLEQTRPDKTKLRKYFS